MSLDEAFGPPALVVPVADANHLHHCAQFSVPKPVGQGKMVE
jgi:hypothetical protein